jgi:hypothetical protein
MGLRRDRSTEDIYMAEKFGNNFDSRVLKSPLTVGRPGNEPGPDVRNNPIAMPKDPLNLIPGDELKAGRGRRS